MLIDPAHKKTHWSTIFSLVSRTFLLNMAPQCDPLPLGGAILYQRKSDCGSQFHQPTSSEVLSSGEKSVISRKGGALLFRLSCKGFVMQSNTESGANGAARLLSISFFFHAIPMLSRVLFSLVVFISTRNLTTLLSLTPMLSATGGLGTCSRTLLEVSDQI